MHQIGRRRRQTTTPALARLLFVASLLVFAISVPLLLMPDRTADPSAWTIKVPLTAAFLGSAYVAAGLAELASSRESVWANARATVPPVFMFTAVTLVITLMNRDAFHFGPEESIAARAVAWTYLGPDGALAAGAGKHFIDMSTAGPDLVADLAPNVAAAGGILVDAPILGAPPVVRGRARP